MDLVAATVDAVMPADGPTADDWLGSGSSSFVYYFSFSKILIPDSHDGFSNQLNFRFASVGTLVLEAVRISIAVEQEHDKLALLISTAVQSWCFECETASEPFVSTRLKRKILEHATSHADKHSKLVS